MGIEKFLLASTVNVVLAQRLVRKICSNCKEEHEIPDEVVEDIKNVVSSIEKNKVIMLKDPEVVKLVKKTHEGKLKLFKGKGCDKCGNTGYKGRLGIFEVLEMSDRIGQLVLESASSGQIEAVAAEEGMLSLMQDGYLRVIEGVTTLSEVMRVTK
jgi:type IV pilus assembly protein PilB